jgi:hypothetical protein
MVQPQAAGFPAGQPANAALTLRVGGVCAIVGASVFATVRLLHGDTPAAHAQAALTFVASRSNYAAAHLFAVLAALVALAGLMVLAHSLARPSACMLGRVGVVSSVIGTPQGGIPPAPCGYIADGGAQGKFLITN